MRGDARRRTEMHGDAQRRAETHRDAQRRTETRRDAQRRAEMQWALAAAWGRLPSQAPACRAPILRCPGPLCRAGSAAAHPARHTRPILGLRIRRLGCQTFKPHSSTDH